MASFPRLDNLTAVDNRARVIVFENLDLKIRIGAYTAEKLAAQRVRISVELLVVPPVALASDRLDEVVNYDTIHGAIMALADAPHVELQETLAETVARICLAPPDVAAVEVYVRKVDVYPDCDSVGIRILRTRPEPQAGSAQHQDG